MTTHRLTEQFTNLSPGAALGIDIGRVLMCPTRDDGRPDTSFLGANDEAALAIPPAPGMFEVVPALVRLFGGRAWLVSKAGPRIEALTRRWLLHHRFFERTAMDASHLRFCRRRDEKRGHADALGLTHFIDDRVDVLSYLRGSVPCLALFGVQAGPIPDWVVHLPDWATLGAALEPGDGYRAGPIGAPTPAS
jgi:hypothetical protein